MALNKCRPETAMNLEIRAKFLNRGEAQEELLQRSRLKKAHSFLDGACSAYGQGCE